MKMPVTTKRVLTAYAIFAGVTLVSRIIRVARARRRIARESQVIG